MSWAEALAAHRRGDFAAAEQGYRAVLAGGPYAPALANLGAILRADGRVAEAEALLRQAVELEPDRASGHRNLGNLFWKSGRLAEAQACYRRVLALEPANAEAQVDLAFMALALGEDTEGWALYDARPERAKALAQPLSFPEWRGEDLAGKRLLIRNEQGFGDQILAARWLPLKAGAAQVTLLCEPELERLFRQFPVDVRARGREDLHIAPLDYWTLPMSLPRWAEPAAVPYLAARPRAAGGRIGLAWRGKARPDPARSMSEAAARRLLARPGVIDLDPAATGARDFQDTAEIVAGLERVISIDTSAAHLAGALGKPLWVLLHHESHDLRWRPMRPFYPQARLFRQPARGDWDAVVEAVEAALDAC